MKYIKFIIFLNLTFLLSCNNKKPLFLKTKQSKELDIKEKSFSSISKLLKGCIYGLIGSKLIESTPLTNAQLDIHEFVLGNGNIELPDIKNLFVENKNCDNFEINDGRAGISLYSNGPFEYYFPYNCPAYEGDCPHLSVSLLGINHKLGKLSEGYGDDIYLTYYNSPCGNELLSFILRTKNNDQLSSIVDLSYKESDFTKTPTNSPIIIPTKNPTTKLPTKDPTNDPTNDPTTDPTNDPTNDPTTDPTNDPTNDPTIDPTNDPTQDPTQDPTNDPTIDPTGDPTNDPTTNPTYFPTNQPTSLGPCRTNSTDILSQECEEFFSENGFCPQNLSLNESSCICPDQPIFGCININCIEYLNIITFSFTCIEIGGGDACEFECMHAPIVMPTPSPEDTTFVPTTETPTMIPTFSPEDTTFVPTTEALTFVPTMNPNPNEIFLITNEQLILFQEFQQSKTNYIQGLCWTEEDSKTKQRKARNTIIKPILEYDFVINDWHNPFINITCDNTFGDKGDNTCSEAISFYTDKSSKSYMVSTGDYERTDDDKEQTYFRIFDPIECKDKCFLKIKIPNSEIIKSEITSIENNKLLMTISYKEGYGNLNKKILKFNEDCILQEEKQYSNFPVLNHITSIRQDLYNPLRYDTVEDFKVPNEYKGLVFGVGESEDKAFLTIINTTETINVKCLASLKNSDYKLIPQTLRSNRVLYQNVPSNISTYYYTGNIGMTKQNSTLMVFANGKDCEILNNLAITILIMIMNMVGLHSLQ